MMETETASEAAARKLRRKTARKVVFAGILVLGLPFAAFVALFIYWKVTVARELTAYKAQARVEGFPVTIDELNAWYAAVPDNENAAFIYREAFILMEASEAQSDFYIPLFNAREIDNRVQAYPRDLVVQTRAYVDACAPILDKFEQASQLSRARYPVDYHEDGPEDPNRFACTDEAVRLLILSSELSILDGDTAQATDRYGQLMALLRATGGEPRFFVSLIRAMDFSNALYGIERALSSAEFSSEQLQALDAAWAGAYRPDGLMRGLAGERCWETAMVDAFCRGEEFARESQYSRYFPFWLDAMPRWAVLTWGNYQQWEVYRGYDGHIPSAAPDWPAVLAKVPPRQNDKEITIINTVPTTIRSLYLVAQREETVFHIARALLAVERYRVDNGGLPESLEECVPDYLPAEFIVDPYNDETLHYLTNDHGGYKVYSVFEDVKDDAGKDRKAVQNRLVGDWVFTVQR